MPKRRVSERNIFLEKEYSGLTLRFPMFIEAT